MTIDEWRDTFAAKKAAGWPLWVTAFGRRGRVLRVNRGGVVVRFDGTRDETLHPNDVKAA
ncbi:hypothetical protein [uncultured Microbacterium sp.]|uniref:hypothetical protein n=1 Tax=uncultured Microbacterium sp. TaxID=191216 RepID=UPI0028E9266A|nr:hypothetical protein [uncultured Microbacterium sp.]